MARNRPRRHRMARFPGLRQIRERQLGWEVTDLVAKLPNGRPSISSIYRLEQGYAIRLASARRVFDAVNDAVGSTLDATKELIVS